MNLFYRKSSCFLCIFLLSFFSLLLSSAHLCLAAEPLNDPIHLSVSSGKLSPSLVDLIDTGQEEIEVIVIFNDDDIRREAGSQRKDLGLKSNNQTILAEKRDKYNSRKSLVFSRLDFQDYVVETDYENLPITHLTINKNALNGLLRMGEVASVQENGVVYMSLAESLPLINAPATHSNGYTGSGTSVAVLDTGVNYTLADFGSCTSPGNPVSCKVAYVQDFAPNDGSLDADGHGTNVSGVVVGVAPDTKIIGLDVFNGLSASYTDIINAINWVIGDTTYNIVAVNLSLGGSLKYTAECPGDSLAVAISNLKTAGITTAVSSGNNNYKDGLTAPACAPDGISVGAVYDANIGNDISYDSGCVDATTAADKVTCFSNSATFLKMLAPGANVTAAGSTYRGTSQAAPHVAGAVAVLKESAPGLSVDEVTTRLTGTGVPVTDHLNSIVTPRLNLYNAVFSDPLIGFTPTSLSFYEIQNGTLPLGQNLTIRNDGGGILSWSVAANQSWLDLTPTGGTDYGNVTVSVNTSSLAQGTYSAIITITGNAGNSPKTIPVSLTVFDPTYTEDFETIDLTNLPWETTGDAAWSVPNTLTGYGGSYSAESGTITDSQGTKLRVSLNLTERGFVHFQLKTSTQPQWDKLIFTVDNSTAYGKWDGWHGETGWTHVISTLEVDAGTHVFSWEYEKDSLYSAGSDKVWIDDIVFPAFDYDVQNIQISPTSHSYGNVAVGESSAVQTFSITNTNSGTNSLNIISSVSIVGTDPGDFSIQSDTCSSQTILPGAGCAVGVIFSPSSTGAKSADLRILSDDPDTQILRTALNGTGLTPFTLTVSKSGSGGGTVTSSPAGIDCGIDCSEIYLDGTSVTLSAVADFESNFDGWSGGGCVGTGNCVVTITAVTEVTASFSAYPPVADFSASPLTGNAPVIVDFSDSSTNTPTSWNWNFGDGGTAAAQNPSYVYQAAGTYTVSLTSTNAGGSDDEIKAGYISVGLCSNQPVRVGVSYYNTIQDSYSATLDGEIITIETHIASFAEDLVFNKDISVTLAQGYNCEYSAQAPGATLAGSLTISAGTLVVEELTIL